ncbi:MAG: hypothetical protein IT242_09220 [Bacteroidia bacterium]|nr:hypothetical protein [Bacteroidia bacterium]
MPKGNTKQVEHFDNQEVRIISIEQNRMQIEMEIDRNVKSIRSLIEKLRPFERQKYYNGLLMHMLSVPVDESRTDGMQKNDLDYSNLGTRDLDLIRELSQKMEQLYIVMNDDIS